MSKTKLGLLSEKKIRSRTRANKAILGDFIVQFENVMDNMRDTIQMILRENGLKIKEYGMILLHDSTAGNLKAYYLGFVKIYHNLILEENILANKYLSKLMDKTEDALKLRNRILHSTWDFFPAIEGHKSDAFSGFRYTINKSQGLVNFFNKLPSKREFQNFNKSLKLLSKAFNYAWHNMKENKPLNKKNINLNLISFAWNGTDFPYQDMYPES